MTIDNRELPGAAHGILGQTEASLASLLGAAQVGIVLFDMDGVIRYANPEAERIVGYRLVDDGKSAWLRVRGLRSDGTGAAEPNSLWRVLSGEVETASTERLIERSDGSRIWIETRTTLIRDEGKSVGAVAVFTDITERKEAWELVRRSEERYRSLVTATAQIVWWTPASGEFEADQRQWRQFTGQSFDEMLGWGWLDAVHPDDRDMVATAWMEAVEYHTIFQVVHRLRRRDGVYRTMSARAAPVTEPSGEIREWIGVHTDVTTERARAQREALLYRIGHELLSADTPEEMLGGAMKQLGEALAVDRCFFARIDSVRNRTHVERDWHRSDLPSIAGHYETSEYTSNLPAVFGKRRSLNISNVADAEIDAKLKKRLQDIGITALLGIPLFDEGRLMATFNVAMTGSPRIWTEDNVRLVETVAAQTRAAVESAKAQEREHAIATTLQRSIVPPLPKSVPCLDLDAFYRPAWEESNLGGDFYEVFQIDASRSILLQGDVSGKGVKAASQVAAVRNMLRYAIHRGESLRDAMAELNDIITGNNLIDGFATLFVAEFDADSYTLKYICCGHDPAFLYRRATGTVEELMTDGAVIGADPNGTFEDRTTHVQAGDVLALYTDGLTEYGPNWEQFLDIEGLKERFRQATSTEKTATDVVEKTIEKVRAYAKNAFRDDACLLVAVVQ
jgi:PAS domain S-box-containing protein